MSAQTGRQGQHVSTDWKPGTTYQHRLEDRDNMSAQTGGQGQHVSTDWKTGTTCQHRLEDRDNMSGQTGRQEHGSVMCQVHSNYTTTISVSIDLC